MIIGVVLFVLALSGNKIRNQANELTQVKASLIVLTQYYEWYKCNSTDDYLQKTFSYEGDRSG